MPLVSGDRALAFSQRKYFSTFSTSESLRKYRLATTELMYVAESSTKTKPSRQYWLSQIEQWKISGQSKADYCREHNLSSGNFYNWCSQQNTLASKPQCSTQVKTLKLLPVNLQDATDHNATVSIQRAVAGIDRIIHHATIIEIDTESFRRKNQKKS